MVGKPYKRQDIVHLLATRHKKKNFHQKVSHFASLNFQPGGFTNVIGYHRNDFVVILANFSFYIVLEEKRENYCLTSSNFGRNFHI